MSGMFFWDTLYITVQRRHWRMAAAMTTDDMIQLGPLRSQSLFQFIKISDTVFPTVDFNLEFGLDLSYPDTVYTDCRMHDGNISRCKVKSKLHFFDLSCICCTARYATLTFWVKTILCQRETFRSGGGGKGMHKTGSVEIKNCVILLMFYWP